MSTVDGWVFVGMGGFIAMRMALRAPERVAALALLGTSGAGEDPEMGRGLLAPEIGCPAVVLHGSADAV